MPARPLVALTADLVASAAQVVEDAGLVPGMVEMTDRRVTPPSVRPLREGREIKGGIMPDRSQIPTRPAPPALIRPSGGNGSNDTGKSNTHER